MVKLDSIQTRDMGKAISMQAKIRKLGKNKQPIEKIQADLEQFVAKSSQKTRELLASFGEVQLQPDLPIASQEQVLIRLLRQHQVVIVAGETGCGKTTQLPKICLKAGLGARGLIAHTQPRRVAATSVAKRIAEELNTNIGEWVGYAVRFNKQHSDKTRIKLMTDGVLLSEIESDPLLSRYEVVIIDEAHERSLNIDFLLGFLKNILQKRQDLKVIITSATIDPKKFSAYFNQAPMLLIEGRSYPVEVRYRPLIEAEGNNTDQLLNGIVAAVDECCAESTGDILIFADGEAQIKSITKKLADSITVDAEILALYARLSIKAQQKIFAPGQKRKIIVSTNVAETSLTVPGICFVIDIGTARVSRFSQRNKIQQLPIEKISKASADQRKGRCGRIAAGLCIRLYSEEDYCLRDDYTAAEINRTNLSSVVLLLKAMNVKDVEHFPFIEPPKERAWNSAFSQLFELSALNDNRQITQLGRAMAKIPADPQLARILVDNNLIAVNEMLVFCALMSVKEVRERPHDKQQKADQCHRQYLRDNSDVLTAIALWDVLLSKKRALSANAFRKWCGANFINFLGWLEWQRVYFQLKEAVELQGKVVNSQPASPQEVHSALIPGFITHIFCQTHEHYYQGVRGLKVWIHPSSLSFKNKRKWLISAELIETEKLYARMNAQIQPQWIEKAAAKLLKSSYKDIHWSKQRGQVVAALSQTLFGLPVVSGRIVNYSHVDGAICREKFLLEGLAQSQLTERFPFLVDNQANLSRLEKQEQKQRCNNIRIDEQSLAELYRRALPDSIVSQSGLKKWLKKDFNKHNRLLSFSLEQLTASRAHSQESYPSEIMVKGFKLRLSYCFAPGAAEDGVSVEIPVEMASQFSDRDFDWLVPGYLEEKVLALIKSLPKSIRRSLIPLSDTAKKCAEELSQVNQENKRFLEALIKILQRMLGYEMSADDFALDMIPAHLKMKFKLIGKGMVYPTQSLAKLAVRDKKISNTDAPDNAKLYLRSWPGEHFEIEKLAVTNKISSRIFQAFCDQNGKLSIQTFSSKKAADASHYRGVARLILIEAQSQLNQFFNTWPDKIELEKLSIRLGGFKSVSDSMALLVAMSLLNKARPICKRDDYLKIKALFMESYRQSIAEKLTQVLPLIKSREKLFIQMAQLREGVYDASIADIRRQLKSLWSPINLLAAGESLFERYKRYQKGIAVRVERIKTNYPKEQAAMEIWKDWLQWWDDLNQQDYRQVYNESFDELYWMLQEFRLSLFSPGVKVIGGASSTKLQQLFEALEKAVSPG